MRPRLAMVVGLLASLVCADAMAQCANGNCGTRGLFGRRSFSRTYFTSQPVSYGSTGSSGYGSTGGVKSSGSTGGYGVVKATATTTTQTASGMECKADVTCPACGTSFKCSCPCQAPVGTQACNCCEKCTGTIGCACGCPGCKCNAGQAPQTKSTNAKLVTMAPDVVPG